VRLTYSNSALLEKMQVHIVEEDPPAAAAAEEDGSQSHAANPFGTQTLANSEPERR
jgi:hypothetical protein